MKIRFRKPPIQRQRWGDEQIVPQTNWGSLFFDLFYVVSTRVVYIGGMLLLQFLNPNLYLIFIVRRIKTSQRLEPIIWQL